MTELRSMAMWIFGLLAGSLLLLEITLTMDFNANILIILLQLDLFTILITWYLILGLFAPKIRSEVWDESDGYDIEDNELSKGFLPGWIQIGLPVLLSVEIVILMAILNQGFNLTSTFVVLLYILGPLVFLRFSSPISLFISVLWVWFPIEWGVITDTLGDLTLSLIPLDALIGLFALLWPLIVYGRHIPWYTWEISRSDLVVVGKSSLFISIAIVPLGLLTNFITVNPDNFLDPEIKVGDNPIINSVVYIILIFYLIFLVQGIMEETLFRDIIFKHQYYWLQDRYASSKWWSFDLGHLLILLAGLLVASIPIWDNILGGLAYLIPIFQPVADRVGSLALPLGEYEGRSIVIIEGLPLWLFYLLVAMLLTLISYILYSKYHTPLMAALLVSSIIFGFAHFQDFRYVFFASIAGFGYGYTYYQTKNIVPAAMVHMGVDAIWVLLLNY